MTELAALNVRITGDSGDLQAELNAAGKSLNTFDKRTQASAKNTTALTGSFGRLSNMSGQTKARLQNVGFQLQDIAVQLQGGTRASVVFAQQGSQLLSIFGPMGALFGTLAAVGIPAIAFAFSQAGEDVEDADEAVTNFIGSLDAVTSALSIAKTPISDLRDEFGRFAEQVRSASLISAQAALSKGMEGLAGAVSAIQEPLSNFQSLLPAYGQALNELRVVQDTFGQRTLMNASAFDEAENKVENARKALEDAASAFGMSSGEVVNLTRALDDLSEAEGMEEVATASANALAIIDKMFPATEKIPLEVANIVTQLEAVLRAASAGVTAFEQMGEAAANVRIDRTPLTSEDIAMAQTVLPVDDADTGGGRDRRGARRNPIEAQLESVRNALMTQEEAQIASFERQQEVLRSALEQQLLTRQEYNSLMQDAESQHSQAMAQIKQQEIAMVSSAQQGMYAELGNLFGVFAQKSKGAAIAQIAINKALSIAQIIQNTAVAQMRALAELGPIAGPPVAAKIGAFGKVQAALAAATGFAQAAGVGGGSAGAAAIGTQASGEVQNAAPVSRNVAISLQGGDMFSRDQVVQLINSINEAVEDGAIVRLV